MADHRITCSALGPARGPWSETLEPAGTVA